MKNTKKIIAAAMAFMMCAAAGCSSSENIDGGAYDGGYDTTAGTVKVNSDNSGGNAGDAPAIDDTYPTADIDRGGSTADGGIVGVETQAGDTYFFGERGGVLQHADGSNGSGTATKGGITGAEAYAVDEANLWYVNAEEYSSIEENGYKSTVRNPLSTFSADVDTASYANVRRMIEYGQNVNPDAVRIEEFINYFDYDYPEPTAADPFSVTAELSDCPWNNEAKLLLVGLKAKDIDMNEREPINLVFLIDVSGSMLSDDKLPLVQKSFTMLTENLGESDRISIVTYAGEDKVVLKGASGEDKDRIIEAINSLEAGGATYGEAGINRAYELAEEYFIEGGNNRVILATDGDLNMGLSSELELAELIEEKRKSGVFLSVLGFGTGNIKDNRMEALADHGNGNYSYIDSELEAKKVLVEEMCGTLYTVAKDVKIQVEFNPANVAGYRLIGYENRALADRDFANDTKDAGEIGAGHTVTALYELVMCSGDIPAAPEAALKYQQTRTVTTVTAENSDELLTVFLRYKQPDGDASKLLSVPVTKEAYSAKMPANMTFAAAAAEFGMILRGSDNRGTASCGQILDMLEGYDYRNDEYKTEFVYLVRTMFKRGY